MFFLEDSHFWFIGKRLFIKTILNKYCQNYKKNLKILDIGCGTGGLTLFLTNWGKVIGIEKNQLAIKLAKKRQLKIIKADAQKLPFSDNKFDLVTIFDVLYHKDINDVIKVIKESYRVLKINGFFLITDSSFNFLKSNHDKILGGNKRFTIKKIEKFLTKSDFIILKSSYIFFFIFPLIFLKRKIIDFIFKTKNSDVEKIANFINWLLIKLISFEAWLLRYLSFPFGSSLIIMAKKSNINMVKKRLSYK